jgi:hypothetical protein
LVSFLLDIRVYLCYTIFIASLGAFLPKNKEKHRDEFHLGEIRRLKKYIRQLEKRVKELEKHEHFPSQDEEVDTTQDDTWPDLPKTCSNCGKGKINIVDIIGRIFEVCNLCGERKKV